MKVEILNQRAEMIPCLCRSVESPIPTDKSNLMLLQSCDDALNLFRPRVIGRTQKGNARGILQTKCKAREWIAEQIFAWTGSSRQPLKLARHCRFEKCCASRGKV